MFKRHYAFVIATLNTAARSGSKVTLEWDAPEGIGNRPLYFISDANGNPIGQTTQREFSTGVLEPGEHTFIVMATCEGDDGVMRQFAPIKISHTIPDGHRVVSGVLTTKGLFADPAAVWRQIVQQVCNEWGVQPHEVIMQQFNRL